MDTDTIVIEEFTKEDMSEFKFKSSASLFALFCTLIYSTYFMTSMEPAFWTLMNIGV